MQTRRPVDQVRVGYSSAVRAKAAQETRRAIVAAAHELFVDNGYAATTIDAIADRAGVGRKTVFSSVGGKGALLKLVWDWTLVGDDEPVPMAERPVVRAILAERDPTRLVRMWVDMTLDVGSRAARVGSVVVAAADADAEVRELRDAIRRESLAGATAFVAHLAGVGGLREGLTVERGADSCFALVNSLVLPLLVHCRGWPLDDVRKWFTRVVSAILLPSTEHTTPEPTVRIGHDVAGHRYEAEVDGKLVGSLSYQNADSLKVLLRTEVVGPDRHGIADALVSAAFADLADGARAVAVCPYVTWWLSHHPEHADRAFQPG